MTPVINGDTACGLPGLSVMEVWGFEPQTYGLQSHRSSHLSYTPALVPEPRRFEPVCAKGGLVVYLPPWCGSTCPAPHQDSQRRREERAGRHERVSRVTLEQVADIPKDTRGSL